MNDAASIARLQELSGIKSDKRSEVCEKNIIETARILLGMNNALNGSDYSYRKGYRKFLES